MTASDKPLKDTRPKRHAQNKGYIMAFAVAGIAVALILLAIYWTTPAPLSQTGTASANTDSTGVDLRLDPLSFLKSFLGSNISQVTNGLAEGQDYNMQPVDEKTNAYHFFLEIGFLDIADEQDTVKFYTDSATNTVNTIEYVAAVPKNEKDPFMAAFSSKMNDLVSKYGNSYETIYKKSSADQASDYSYTYRKIYDALASGQDGIYKANWQQKGLVVTLTADTVSDPDNYSLALAYWDYE